MERKENIYEGKFHDVKYNMYRRHNRSIHTYTVSYIG